MCIPSWQSISVIFDGWDDTYENALFHTKDRSIRKDFALKAEKVAEDVSHPQIIIFSQYRRAFEQAIDAYNGTQNLKAMVARFEKDRHPA